VADSPDVPSFFSDNEYCIYDTKQQILQYIVRYRFSRERGTHASPKVVPASDHPLSLVVKSAPESIPAASLQAFEVQPGLAADVKPLSDANPLAKVVPGLQSNSGEQLPLRSVHVRGKVVDMVAQVVVLQEYHNFGGKPIEAKYVFPLDDRAAVCGFEAFINGKHVVGRVKEKEQARREYKEAIAQGHGAYLMEESEETPDVFSVAVGNLPASATVLIKITYVAELACEGDDVCFYLPDSVAPVQQSLASSVQLQTQTSTVHADNGGQEGSMSVEIAVHMPSSIRAIRSPSHGDGLLTKLTDTMATVRLAQPNKCSLGGDFVLLMTMAEVHVPRMLVEVDTTTGHRVNMLAFYPEFEVPESNDWEIVLMLDQSASMAEGQAYEALQSAAKGLLELLPKGVGGRINVVSFGTGFDYLYPSSRPCTEVTVREAIEYVSASRPVWGGSDVWPAIQSLVLMNRFRPGDGLAGPQNVVLFSDGQLGSPYLMVSECACV
jgi:poly [ADP-ribose] polymerase 2/3/4